MVEVYIDLASKTAACVQVCYTVPNHNSGVISTTFERY